MTKQTKKKKSNKHFTRKKGGANNNTNNINNETQSADYRERGQRYNSSNYNNDAPPSYYNEVKASPLMILAEHGTFSEFMEELDTLTFDDIAYTDNTNQTVLMYAAISDKDSVKKIEAIIQKLESFYNIRNQKSERKIQSFIDFQEERGETALHICLANENVDGALKLIELGSDVTLQNDTGKNALIIACEWLDDDKDILQCIKNIGISFVQHHIPSYLVNTRNKSNLPKVKERIRKEFADYINLEPFDTSQMTAMEAAVTRNRHEVMKLLVQLGAKITPYLVKFAEQNTMVKEETRKLLQDLKK